MFRKRIAFQLTTGFVFIVLITMLTLGVIFVQIFSQYAFETRQQDMLEKARSISQMVSENVQANGQMRGFGGLMRFLDTMSQANVWIIDKQANPLTLNGIGMGKGSDSGVLQMHAFYSGPLPEEAESVINKVNSGQESISRSFSELYDEATLTVGVPIFDSNKTVIGSVLLHTPVTGITSALDKTIRILLLSLVIALMIAVSLGGFYSLHFTRPLKTMNNTALKMAQGKYSARTGIKRQDEIGQLADTLDFLAAELAKAMDKINQLEQVRRDFVANVSHEFRTPLTVIRGSLEALSDGTIDKPADVERYYQRMLSETRSLERLVSDLLELSRLQSGKITIHWETIHIPSLLTELVKSMQTIADRKNIKIDCDLPSAIPPIPGDYDRLRQLFIIFIDNAIKYSPDNTTISISVLQKNTLNVVIQDQGYGISEEELPHIWDRFYKTVKSRKDRGTGLGLSIAKHLAQALNCRVSLESHVGQGTRVLLEFATTSE